MFFVLRYSCGVTFNICEDKASYIGTYSTVDLLLKKDWKWDNTVLDLLSEICMWKALCIYTSSNVGTNSVSYSPDIACLLLKIAAIQ